MSQVFFVPKGGPDKIGPILRKLVLEDFAGQDVLVKVHMGERENKWYVKPEFVKVVTDELKNLGSTPFLYDTTVIYGGQRTTREKHENLAREHGFDKIGCAVVIGDKGNVVPLSEEGIDFKFEVAEELSRTKNVVSIVHAKGHSLTGFAGTIKNLGMGGVSKACKLAMHTASLRRKVATLGKSPATFNKILAMGAKACLLGKKVVGIHVLLDITKECDCSRNALPIICRDLGYLLSRDPVAIEAASIDMIIKDAGPAVFKRDPWEQVEFAAKIGLGSRTYELVDV
ncbi:MAG: DUF362 domain-containing protein [Candidatus Aminicenantes bacterium]|nr:DUF362 domain-containing protein [Candidatus Aminicenantes bacterium]